MVCAQAQFCCFFLSWRPTAQRLEGGAVLLVISDFPIPPLRSAFASFTDDNAHDFVRAQIPAGLDGESPRYNCTLLN
jgi:hypothetical protein